MSRERAHRLDRLARLDVPLFGRRRQAFAVCGLTGIVLDAALGLALAAQQQRSVALMGAIAAATVLTFLLLAAARAVLVADGTLVYHHYEFAILVVAGLVAAAAGEPLLPYLDMSALGLALFLTCARVGCLMVGCCHGRPARWGIAYPAEHVHAGFDGGYVGVRLVPVQALESALALAIAVSGTAMILGGAEPGTALAWYVCAYAAGRFGLEILRGDAGRPHLLGLSQAQLLSLASAAAVTVAQVAGLLPVSAAAIAAVALLSAEAAALRLTRARRGALRVAAARPSHAREVVMLVGDALEPGTPLRVACTSLGIGVSGGALPGTGGPRHVTISHCDGALDERVADDLARLVAAAGRAGDGHPRVVRGAVGAWHVVLDRDPVRAGG